MASSSRAGFTLIELAFVVGIIGILASIAIPNFTIYQRQAKATEAMIALETIVHLEQVAILETGDSIACEPQPEAIPTDKVHFEPTEAWQNLGFVLQGRTRYQYEVERPEPRRFVAIARGDLNGDGVISTYRIDSRTLELTRENPAD